MPRPLVLDLDAARARRGAGHDTVCDDAYLPRLLGGLGALVRRAGAVVSEDPSNDDAVALLGEAIALLARFERGGIAVDEPAAA